VIESVTVELDPRIPARIRERIDFDSQRGCLIGTGWLTDDGYAICSWEGKKKVRVIRLLWKLLTGKWPRSDREMLHSCDNRACVHVGVHVKPGTRKRNAIERQERGRTRGFRTYKKEAA